MGELLNSAISLAERGVGRNGDIEVPISAISAAVNGVGRNCSMDFPSWLGDGELAAIGGSTSVREAGVGIGSIWEGGGNW